MLGVYERGYVIHRAGPVERYHGGHVAERRRLEFLDVARHAAAFQLEDADGFAPRHDVEGIGVVQRDVRQVEADVPGLGDEVARLRQDGQVHEAEEVHLQQAERGHRVHGVLRGGGDRAVVVGALRALQRHHLVQGLLGYDHRRRVRAGVARHPFQALGGFDQVADGLVGADGLGEFGAWVGLGVVQRDAEPGGYHPRDSVHVAVGHGERASDVAYGGAGAHRAERDDMGHVFAPVLFDHVVDDFLAAVVLEVHVNVRHFLAFQVQESLEYEPVGERVHVGHAQAVEREAGGGASAHREEYVAFPHEAGYVPDHEEVVIESGLAYDFKLIAQPFLLALARVRQAAFQPFPADIGQVLERGQARPGRRSGAGAAG